MPSQSSNTSCSSTRRRRYARGIPTTCDCGASIVKRLSKTDLNPGREYYRCSVAATQTNAEEFHCFKWVDEAVEQEVVDLLQWRTKVQNDIDLLGAGIIEMQRQIENEVSEIVNGAMVKMQMKILAYIVGVCVIVVGIVKFL